MKLEGRKIELLNNKNDNKKLKFIKQLKERKTEVLRIKDLNVNEKNKFISDTKWYDDFKEEIEEIIQNITNLDYIKTCLFKERGEFFLIKNQFIKKLEAFNSTKIPKEILFNYDKIGMLQDDIENDFDLNITEKNFKIITEKNEEIKKYCKCVEETTYNMIHNYKSIDGNNLPYNFVNTCYNREKPSFSKFDKSLFITSNINITNFNKLLESQEKTINTLSKLCNDESFLVSLNMLVKDIDLHYKRNISFYDKKDKMFADEIYLIMVDIDNFYDEITTIVDGIELDKLDFFIKVYENLDNRKDMLKDEKELIDTEKDKLLLRLKLARNRYEFITEQIQFIEEQNDHLKKLGNTTKIFNVWYYGKCDKIYRSFPDYITDIRDNSLMY